MFPERQYQNSFPACVKILYRVSQNTAVQKCVRVFCKKEYVWSKITHFYEKYVIVSKPMTCNKNADALFFYCYLLRVNVKKDIEKTFVSAGTQEGEKERVLGVLYRNIYRILKANFQ